MSHQDLLAGLIAGLKGQGPGFARFGVGLALRGLAGNKECLDAMASAMAEDEDEDWSKLDGKARRLWRLRARASLVGLDRWIAEATTHKLGT